MPTYVLGFVAGPTYAYLLSLSFQAVAHPRERELALRGAALRAGDTTTTGTTAPIEWT